MLNSTVDARLVVGILIFGVLFGVPILLALRRARQDRRTIMADGVTALAVITKIGASSRTDRCWVHFTVQPTAAHRPIRVKQRTTQTAVDKLGLTIGSTAEVHFLPKWPKYAFIDSVVRAERGEPGKSLISSANSALVEAPALFYISYAGSNRFRWFGSGDLVITTLAARFTARQRQRFWFPKEVSSDVTLDHIINVEPVDAAVRLEIREPGGGSSHLQFMAVDARAAESIATLLPSTKSPSFVPVLAEGAAFNTSLLAVTPTTPVTATLIIINVLMFLVVIAFGGGLFKVNSEVMIHLGTDYTPLTLGGQWWRLLTSIFLHFGLLHIAFNMWALYANGEIAERIFGSVRYLIIYLASGVCGSVVSLLWHPIVNGAGASGAIFGIFGAMLAFFLKREGGVPSSVIKAQLSSVSLFVVYSLLTAASVRGVDNAAHMGGLAAGFVLGFVLSRPLDASRGSKTWTLQWAIALVIIFGSGLGLAHLIAAGVLAPRLARDRAGNVIPLAGLEPPIHSLGGINLNMSSEDLIRMKGVPIVQDDSEWVYNSVDAAHDGVITVSLSGSRGKKTVWAVEFTGHDQTSAPAEMPYLNSLVSEEVVRKYGQPVASQPTPDGTSFLWFRNGVYVGTRNDKVYRYGIFDPAQLPR